MNTEVVDSATEWTDDHFIAGDVALDFANTVYRRTPELGADLFDSADTLAAWLARAELLPRTDMPVTGFDDPRAALREARVMREQFWAIFEAQKDGRSLPADALGGLFEMARRGLGDDANVNADGSTTSLTTHGALTVVALRGLRLALSPAARPVQSCDRCGWFFIDTSRGRRRRWCSMKTCGNQAKAARYRSAHP